MTRFGDFLVALHAKNEVSTSDWHLLSGQLIGRSSVLMHRNVQSQGETGFLVHNY